MVKAHNVRTSAGNIVGALCDSFTMYLLQSKITLAMYARFKDHFAFILQCLHDWTVIALSSHCCLENILRWLLFVFQIRPYGASSYVTACKKIWNCRAMAFCWPSTVRRGIPTKDRAGAAYLWPKHNQYAKAVLWDPMGGKISKHDSSFSCISFSSKLFWMFPLLSSQNLPIGILKMEISNLKKDWNL